MRIIIGIAVILALVGGFYWFSLNKSPEYYPQKESEALNPSDDTVSLVAAGDIACDSLEPQDQECQQEATAKIVEQIDPDKVLTLGDIQYGGGSLEDYLNYFDKSWGRFKNRIRPAVGNHDFESAGAEGYFDYFNGQNNQNGLAGDRSKGYYSYYINGWAIYALNTNCGSLVGCTAESEQAKWLEAELTKNQSKCQIAYSHQPLFSSGWHGIVPSTKPLWQIMYNHQAEIFLSGHDHLYERFGLQNPEGKADPEKGMRQFVVGTGGKNLYKIGQILPNSEVRIDDSFGVLQLDLKQNAYDWKFIDTNNQVRDSGSGVCF